MHTARRPRSPAEDLRAGAGRAAGDIERLGVVMARSDDLYELPSGLPVPEDDGTCAHLTGMRMPSVPLPSTGGSLVDIARLRGRTVAYCYPRTGRPKDRKSV